MPQLRAAVWDMDGTLFDTERLHLLCWEEVLRAEGFDNTRETILKMVGRKIEENDRTLRRDFGADFDVDAARARKIALTEERVRRDGVPVKAGAREALRWIAGRGIPQAVASSTYTDVVLSYLERSGLGEYFGAVVGGDQAPRGKPHPDIFLKAAAELSLPPEHCVAFEDSFNGVKAAHAAGMCVVMIPDLQEPTPEILALADHTLRSLEEATALLSRIFA